MTEEQLAREARESQENRDDDDDEDPLADFISLDDDDESGEEGNGDWAFVPADQPEALEDFIEDEEEERRNWEEYKRASLKGKTNLRSAAEVKPSGALVSGQKKRDTRPRPDRSTPQP